MKKIILIQCLFSIYFTKIQSQNTICFDPLVNISTAAYPPITPLLIVSDDFNNDGFEDLVTSNMSNYSISLYLGNGTGNFTFQNNFNTAPYPLRICSADFNNDGKKDIVTNNIGSNISVLLGTGTGSFNAVSTYTTGTNANPASIVANDFNNDGFIDISYTDQSNPLIKILYNNGSGAFNSVINYSLAVSATNMESQDYNGDGKPDLVVILPNTSIFILLSNNLNALNLPVAITTTFVPNSGKLTSGDFNNDSKNDFVIAESGNLYFFAGNGLGGFLAPFTSSITGTPTLLKSSDFDGDGNLDVAYFNPTNVNVVFGNGLGGFSNSQTFTLTTSMNDITIGNFNSDIKKDMAFCSSFKKIVILNSCNLATDVIQNNNEPSFSIYPNPVDKELHIVLKEASQITVKSTYGSVISINKLDVGPHILNLFELSTGMFFIEILNKNESISNLKFIKN